MPRGVVPGLNWAPAVNRQAAYGRKPPAWERITFIRVYRLITPLSVTCTTVRVVSKGKSSRGLGMPSSMGIGGAVGWTKTTAARASNSAQSGANSLSPR